MKYEDLLLEVIVFCGFLRNSLCSFEGLFRLKMEDFLKNFNYIQLSKINMDSILFQFYIMKDKQMIGEEVFIEDFKLEERIFGRFVGFFIIMFVVLFFFEEDDDEEVEFVEDIFGLDEFIYSQLDLDDNFDEEILLFGEDIVVIDKIVKNFLKVEVLNKEDLDFDQKFLYLV